MKFGATSILLAAFCLSVPALTSCSARAGRASGKSAPVVPKPAAPAPPPVDAAAQIPVSVPQTQVTLPSPQPIQAEALATILPDSPPPEPVNPAVRPACPAPRSEPRQQTTLPTPAGPEASPPATPAAPRRLRPVEAPAERQRLLAGITARQRQVQDVLAKVKNRQLSDTEKSAVERIQSFLEQANAALKDQDLQQAEALSNRALLLCQELGADR